VINSEDDLWEITGRTAHLLGNVTRYDMPGAVQGVLTLELDRVVDRIEDFLA